MTSLRSALERYLSMRGHDHHHEAGDGVGDAAARSACDLGVAID
jgi:hypothetical protein